MFLSNLNFSLFFTSLLTTLLITFLAKPFFLRLGLVDIPNPRSNHNFPVALGGGIIITLLILSLGLYSKISFSFTCYSVFIMLFAISLLDDIKNINATIRLLFHMLCVFLYVHNYLIDRVKEQLPELENHIYLAIYVFAIIGITWFINGFNFMDGIDGITSIQVIFIMLALIILESIFLFDNINHYLIILGVMFGFLFYNWHPAKIFLGDAGSIPLGFLMIYFLIELTLKGYWCAAVILSMYYFLDTTITLLKRIFNGKKFWQSHNDHFYQIFVKKGNSHSKTCYYIITISLGLFFFCLLSVLYKNNVAFLFLSLAWCLIFINHFSKSKSREI